MKEVSSEDSGTSDKGGLDLAIEFPGDVVFCGESDGGGGRGDLGVDVDDKEIIGVGLSNVLNDGFNGVGGIF